MTNRSLTTSLLGSCLVSALVVASGCQSAPTAAPGSTPESPAPGATVGVTTHADPEAMRLALFWNAEARTATLKMGTRVVKGAPEFAALLTGWRADMAKAQLDANVVIDAAAEVPWGELVRVIEACRSAGATRVELAVPAPEGAR